MNKKTQNQLEVISRTFEGNQIRITQRGEEFLFCAKDVCAVLEIKNGSDAISRLDDDEKKGVGLTDTLGGPQKMTFITYSGLLSLILGSRKPEAKSFKRWVTHEVLPSLSRDGYYEMPNCQHPRKVRRVKNDEQIKLDKTREARLCAAERRKALLLAEKHKMLIDPQLWWDYFALASTLGDGVATNLNAVTQALREERLQKIYREKQAQKAKQTDIWDSISQTKELQTSKKKQDR